MVVVLGGVDPVFKRSLAIKVIAKGLSTNPEMKSRFLDEARLMGQLQHPGIPPVHALGELSDGRPYFAMKLIKGETLEALLKPTTKARCGSPDATAVPSEAPDPAGSASSPDPTDIP